MTHMCSGLEPEKHVKKETRRDSDGIELWFGKCENSLKPDRNTLPQLDISVLGN